MTRDSAKSLRHSFFLIVTLALLILSTIFLSPRPAHADEGGGWIGSGGIGEGGGSGGSINVNDCSKNNRFKYMLECTGYSWVFYRNTGWKAGDVYFVPYTSEGNKVKIPQECSEHTDQNGGFWHLGRNAMASHSSGIDYAYFANNDYAGYYGSNASSKYYTVENKWGHLGTYQYGFVPNSNNWATYMGEGSQIHGANIQLSGGNLYHYLYKDGSRVYYATKYGSINQVFEDYKKAYKYVNGSTPSDMNGVWGFCYWDGMSETNNVTFTIKSIDDQGASLSHLMPDRVKTVPSGSNVILSVGLLEGYTKTKWGDSTNPSTWVNSNNLTFQVIGLKQDLTKYAVYHRNSFKGRAAVYEGPNTSSPNHANTGYVSDNTTADTLNIDCETGPCQASFYFYLRPSGTLGETYYKISRNDSILSNHNNVKIIPRLFGQQIAGFTETLTPGQTVCYTLEFKPYGNKPNSTYAKAKVCAHATISTFEGKSDLTGAASDSTGWQKANTDKTFKINNCSPINGCKVTFRHSLRRTNGTGSTNWRVARTSNLIVSPKAISPNPNIANGIFNPGSSVNSNHHEIRVRTSEELTLYPGMVICEKLYFFPTGKSTSLVHTGVCASALGKAQPEDPDPDIPEDPDLTPSDNSFLNIKVRNSSVSRYRNFQREVYAKPGDELVFRATYNPILQYTYHIIPQRMRISNGPIYPINGRNTSAKLVAMFNLYKPNHLENWNNSISVIPNNNFSSPRNFTYPLGNPTKRGELSYHTVKDSEAGSSYNESAALNSNRYIKSTPSQVSFSDIDGDNTAKVIANNARIITAYARIPYNFINTTKITKDPGDVLYAGETANVDFTINVKPKRNSITQGYYATIVRNAEWELMVCYNHQCHVTDKNIGYKTGNLLPGSPNDRSISFNVPDVPAGTEVCLSSMVYPADSGADTNWLDPSGSHTWAYSPQRCFKVAKRPSIQTWGGILYTHGAINMTDAIKNNLANYTDYQVEGTPHRSYIFGSWTELGLVSNGPIKGLSSGASIGYNANNNGDLWPNYHPPNGHGNNQSINGRSPGGSNKKSLCNRSPLTFANTCKNGLVGSIGSISAVSNANKDKAAIISTFLFGGNANITDPHNVTLNHESNRREGTNIYYYNGGNQRLTIPGNMINKATIQVVHTKNDVTINGNLEYQDGYSTLEEIPKLIIYTDKEIRIGCNVTRIDAVLIADSVLTCDNLSGNSITKNNIEAKINDPANSNQLKVNGAIITGKLYPNRTYGAATGANSIIPAEIINFDPSLYTWGTTTNTESTTSDGNRKNTLDTVYRKELPPRY